MNGIAISYRREDTGWITGRIFDRLKIHYETHESRGSDNPIVFMDYDSIPVGVDFRNHIMAVLDKCEILLAIIGPKWFGDDRLGRNRLMEETDWVRIEIEYALKKNIPVVPVLIDRTPMPAAELLPECLRDLVYRQAAIIDAQIDFNSHIDRLIRQIDRHPGVARAKSESGSPGTDSAHGMGLLARGAIKSISGPMTLRIGLWLLPLAIFCVVLIALLLSYFGQRRETRIEPIGQRETRIEPNGQRETRIEPIYTVYSSSELGVTVSFPHNILALDNTERTQLRLTLRDANGVPLVRILRTALPGVKDIRERRQQEINELRESKYEVTYVAPEQERNWSNWYVLSAVRDGSKFYFRRWYSADSVVSMEFTYPFALASQFDSLIIPTMTREFKFSSMIP